MPICILCIGSNCNRRANLLLARRKLKELFPTIRFATELDTKPLFFTNPATFSNQVAVFATELSAEVIVSILKEIERQAGRLSDDKQHEKVRLDIDLLCYDNDVLKSRDLHRDYVQAGLKELQIESY